MLASLLARFPPHAHALTLIADPDGLLGAEVVGAALAERGFRVVREADPVALRVRIEQARPWSEEQPLLVVGDALAALPYDCWIAASNHLELRLGDFFPHLAAAELRQLRPDQLQRLAHIAIPTTQLTTTQTKSYLLEHLFGATAETLAQPAELVSWLSRLHASEDMLPLQLQEELLSVLTRLPVYNGWDLPELLSRPVSFDRFLQDQWGWYLNTVTGHAAREPESPYLIHFSIDSAIQDRLPQFLRDGSLIPEPVDDPMALPAWARPGASAATDQARREHTSRLVNALADALTDEVAVESFLAWTKIAQIAARLDSVADIIASEPSLTERHAELVGYAHDRFMQWLPVHYRSLTSLALPSPHHLYHIPDFLAFQRRQRATGRVAIIVLDGMSMVDWIAIGDHWRANHPSWHLLDRALLAQIPTITSISRQALFSGLRPIDFSDSLLTTAREPVRWQNFWIREGLSVERAQYLKLTTNEPVALPSTGSAAVAIVETSIDDLVHAAKLGDTQLRVDRKIWLEKRSPRLEATIDTLLSDGFGVWITSDHGHVEALGVGQPNDGSLADLRAKRARLYTDRTLAVAAATKSPGAVLWGDDGLLPSNRWAVIPPSGKAFAHLGSSVVTHGGTSFAEVIVPFIEIDLD